MKETNPIQVKISLLFLPFIWIPLVLGFASPGRCAEDITVKDTICITTRDTITISGVDGTYLPVADLDTSSFRILRSLSLAEVVVHKAEGRIEIRPAPYRTGIDEIEFEICNTSGDCYDISIVLFIDPWNTVTPLSDNIITFEGAAVKDNFLFNDYDAERDSLYTMLGGIMTGEAKGTASATHTSGEYIYTPPPRFTGRDRMEYILSDTVTPPTIRNAYIHARIVDRNPPCDQTVMANPDTYLSPINGTIIGNVLWNDMDILYPSSTLELKITPIEGPIFGRIQFSPDGSFTYTSARNSLYLESIHYKVCREDLTCSSCDSSWLYIRVGMDKIGACIDIPKATQDGFNAGCNTHPMEGELIDPNTVPSPYYLKPTPVLAPQHGTVTWDSAGHYTYTPQAGYSGPDRFGYEICKTTDTGAARLACTKASTLIMVFNQSPIIATDDYRTVQQGAPIEIHPLANDFDPEGQIDPQSFKILSNARHGSLLSISDTTFQYTSSANYQGADSILYSICDQPHLCGDATCDTATIYVEVQAPMAVHFESFDVYTSKWSYPVLRWVTSNASTGARGIFAIKRSLDGQFWNTIAFIEEPSNIARSHEYEDRNIPLTHPGNIFYKIEYSNGGLTAFSPIRSMYLTGNESARKGFYPNPATDKIAIRDLSTSDIVRISIYDTKGQRYLSINNTSMVEELVFDINLWDPGLYLYEIQMKTGEVYSGKIIKE